MRDLNYLISNQNLRFCPLEPTESFVKFCIDRGIETSREQLALLEELDLFYPLARIRQPQRQNAISEAEAEWLQKDGDIWDPAVSNESEKRGQLFLPWPNVRRGPTGHLLESFYSRFQCYSLFQLLRKTKIAEIRAENWVFYNKTRIEELMTSFQARALEIISINDNSSADLAATVCQIISIRYFPYARSDQRHLSFPCELSLPGWDWWDFRSQWDAHAVLARLNIEMSDLEELWRLIEEDRKAIDPLENWSELMSFVSVDKRDELKGAAQFAQTLRSMEDMISMFCADLMIRNEKDVDETASAENTSQRLQYLVTQYHLNPRPRLILVVEGYGEAEQFPRFIEEILEASLSNLEIEVTNLQGIGGFTGDKKRDRYGALERFIDFNHHHETLVFIILDNEGRAPEVKRNLIQKQSRYFEKRTVTREEYIVLWDSSVEFSNFTDEEIAQSLTHLSDDHYTFQASEVQECRRSKTGNPLRALLNTKTQGRYDLNKRELLRKLFDTMLASSPDEFFEKIGSRPIFNVLGRVVRLAGFAPRAYSRDHWIDKQFQFGHTSIPEVESFIKAYFGRLFPKQRID